MCFKKTNIRGQHGDESKNGSEVMVFVFLKHIYFWLSVLFDLIMMNWGTQILFLVPRTTAC